MTYFVSPTGDVFDLDPEVMTRFQLEAHETKIERGELRPVDPAVETVREVRTVIATMRDGSEVVSTKWVLEAVAVERATIPEPSSERDMLMAQAVELGLDPHHKVGVKRLREMIAAATPAPAVDPEDEPVYDRDALETRATELFDAEALEAIDTMSDADLAAAVAAAEAEQA